MRVMSELIVNSNEIGTKIQFPSDNVYGAVKNTSTLMSNLDQAKMNDPKVLQVEKAAPTTFFYVTPLQANENSNLKIFYSELSRSSEILLPVSQQQCYVIMSK